MAEEVVVSKFDFEEDRLDIKNFVVHFRYFLEAPILLILRKSETLLEIGLFSFYTFFWNVI